MTPSADLVARLRAAGCVFAEDEARLLLGSGGDVDALVGRRIAGEPLEHLLGWAEFCGVRVVVEPGVFVPRQRSALLVREAAGRVREGDVVIDLCCGTGALGAALAAQVPGIEVHAADIDPVAVRCARRNVAHVHQGDLYDALPAALRGTVAALLVNAPYVPTGSIATMPREARDHEALVALDGGRDGLAVQRRVADGAAGWLAPHGRVLVETSAQQAVGTAELFGAAGFATRIVHDPDLDATAVLATADTEG